MVTLSKIPHEKFEKPAPSTIALRPGIIRVAMTIAHVPDLLWGIPITGGHAEPDSIVAGKKVMGRITDVCLGTELIRTHRLASVVHKDVSFGGKRRDKFIFELVPEEWYDAMFCDRELLGEVFAVLSEQLAREAFHEAMVYDNGERGMCIEFRGQARRQNANKSFVIG
jgi:hypothetical protein